MEIFVMKTFMN